ncbi:MAG TPA: hypothetical protein VH351_18315 [Bryobacteraceae bacterium]|jgi:hypothetical protein|nr:hypothetical protein [Bryobacteraceae bacterium]
MKPSLRALLGGAIDYAGCFPPASLPLDRAAENYLEYLHCEHSWMLGRFVVRAEDVSKLDGISHTLNGRLAVVGADHESAASVEIASVAAFEKPTYCEVSLDELEAVREAGSYAKIRTGGMTPSAIPSAGAVSTFMQECARLRLPFKATAGLHHPLRGMYRLTYADDAPVGCMHGFINLLFAACWLWSGVAPGLVETLLKETDSSAFRFEDAGVYWCEHLLSTGDIVRARREFVHSFGSCSFSEPVEALQELGWL